MANVINYDLLWQKIGRYAKKIERASARPVVTLLRNDKQEHTQVREIDVGFGNSIRGITY